MGLAAKFSGWLLLIVSAAAMGQAAPPGRPSEPQADDPAMTLRVNTRVVAVSAVVKSRDGKPKTGLTRDDFVLKQDGKEVPIRYFSQGSELPLTIAVMVDVSASQRTFIGDETLASDIFFQTVLGRPQDRAMLVQIDANVKLLHGLTDQPSALHLGLMGLGSNPSTSGATLLQDAIFYVSKNFLAKEQGRKAILLLTDGGDNGSRSSLQQAIEQAQRADVQVYSILYSEAASSSARQGPGAVPWNNGLDILQKLSEATGGHVFRVTPGFGLHAIYSQIAEDLRLQYALGYTPPPDVQPNQYHRLELRAKDKGLIVEARKGFFGKP